MEQLANTRRELQRVATHVLARRRHAVTGRFGLRATPGGFGTPAFGPADAVEVVRVDGADLVHEVGGDATVLPLDGATLGGLAEVIGVDLAAAFEAGHDTPPLGAVDVALSVDLDAARAIAEWFDFGWRALDAAVASASKPSTIQLWPEHFDAGCSVAIGPGADHRCNLGASPGDAHIRRALPLRRSVEQRPARRPGLLERVRSAPCSIASDADHARARRRLPPPRHRPPHPDLTSWAWTASAASSPGRPPASAPRSPAGLVARGAHVGIVARNPAKAKATVDELGGGIDVFRADLGELVEVRRLAGELRERWDRIDVLVNNAGINSTSAGTTAEGYDAMVATNYLGPFLLTNLVTDRFVEGSRVVNVASEAHRLSDRLDPDTFEVPSTALAGNRLYGRTKLALMLFTQELASRLEGAGVTANSCCPGLVATNLAGDASPLTQGIGGAGPHPARPSPRPGRQHAAAAGHRPGDWPA